MTPMQVFISYDTIDASLAHRLRSILKEKGIKSYLFDLHARYDSTLFTKITDAMNDSQALIAIITKGHNSMSVHEEIGYSVAKDKPVIIMLEKDADDGVLSHERDKEIFTKTDFEYHIPPIIKYLENIPNQNRLQTEIQASDFIKTRNLHPESDNFLQNPNSNKLESVINDPTISSDPIVLFSSCPVKLLDNISVATDEYGSWLKNFQRIFVEETNINFCDSNRRIGFESVTYSNGDASKFTRYLEICKNGFVEQGFTKSLMHKGPADSAESKIRLHSCWLTGAFYAFLIFCNKHYTKFKYFGEIHIFLTIRDSDKLMLMGFGGESRPDHKWAEPFTFDWWGAELPYTREPNLCMQERHKVTDLSKEQIKEITRRFSTQISNAYGLECAMCYNYEGTLNQELLAAYN